MPRTPRTVKGLSTTPRVVHRRGKAPRKPLTAEQKAAASARMQANRAVTVNLTMKHVRNGKVFGPGTCTLPTVLASDLLNTEHNARIQEERFYGTKAVIIGGRTRQGTHQITQVPVETFDDSLGNAQPFTTIKGGDKQ